MKKRTKRMTKEKYIKKFKKIHKNKYNYSKFTYKGCNEKSIIICKIHNDFYQTPNNHSRGNGCPKCANNIKSNKKKFKNKSNKIHGNKYNYSKFIYSGALKKSIIICKTHGEFLQTPIKSHDWKRMSKM